MVYVTIRILASMIITNDLIEVCIVLVCERHKHDPKNKKIFEDYKNRFIINPKSAYKEFSRNISLSFHARALPGSHVIRPDANQQHIGMNCNEHESVNDELENSIYMLQTIEIDRKRVNLFFESGCGDMVCRKGAVFNLRKKGRASREIKGPLVLSGIGDNKTVSTHGIY